MTKWLATIEKKKKTDCVQKTGSAFGSRLVSPVFSSEIHF
jgi:hypothetical protein